MSERIEIVERDGKLIAEHVRENGERDHLLFLFDAEESWWKIALDTRRSRDHRKQAIDALIQIAHDSHEYDCADF